MCLSVVALAPLATTLLRTDSYRSSASIALAAPDLGFAPVLELRALERFLKLQVESEAFGNRVVRRTDWLTASDDVSEHVSLRGRAEGDRPEVVVDARAGDPQEAQTLADLAAVQLMAVSEPAARALRAGFLRLTRRQLREENLSSESRRTLADRERKLARWIRSGDDVLVAGEVRSALPAQGLVDRVVGVLPGRTPPTPAPGWAALAGLALASALGLCVLSLGGVGRRTGAGTAE
jgi:hypothetical protein